MTTKSDDVIITKAKAWLFQPLLSILACILTFVINDMRGDIKSLVAQSNIDKTRIDNLERSVYSSKHTSTINSKLNYKDGLELEYITYLFRHEEEFDIKKYLLPKKIIL